MMTDKKKRIRSHTPKPSEGQKIQHSQSHRFLSPGRRLFEGHQASNEVSKQVKHGDVMLRSLMYSTCPCPHCGRVFAEKAALRHIPICATIKAKPKTLEEKRKSNI